MIKIQCYVVVLYIVTPAKIDTSWSKALPDEGVYLH